MTGQFSVRFCTFSVHLDFSLVLHILKMYKTKCFKANFRSRCSVALEFFDHVYIIGQLCICHHENPMAAL